MLCIDSHVTRLTGDGLIPVEVAHAGAIDPDHLGDLSERHAFFVDQFRYVPGLGVGLPLEDPRDMSKADNRCGSGAVWKHDDGNLVRQ